MKKFPISVCIVSGAEAHRIRGALESVADWAGEIVVVLNDTVTDGTDDIAAGFGARVFREPWAGHVAGKQSATEKCAMPWVLCLDADEVVSEPLRDEIQAVVTAPDGPYPAFEFPRCTFYCGRWIRHGDWYPDRVRRLWRRGVGRWTGEEPHAWLQVNGRIGRLKSDLLHFSNEDIARQISKIAPYHAFFVRQRLASGKPVGCVELFLRPAWRFVRAYFLRAGFLDGWRGFYIAVLSSFSTATRYALAREAQERPRNLP